MAKPHSQTLTVVFMKALNIKFLIISINLKKKKEKIEKNYLCFAIMKFSKKR